MTTIRRKNTTQNVQHEFHVGELVEIDETILRHNGDQGIYHVRTILGPKQIRLSGFINATRLLSTRTVEITNIRSDKTPSVVIRGKSTYLVRVKSIDNDESFVVPAMYLKKRRDVKESDEDLDYVDMVRRIHISVIEQDGVEQPKCPWCGTRAVDIRVAGSWCQNICSLKLFSKGDYIYCRGTMRKKSTADEDDRLP